MDKLHSTSKEEKTQINYEQIDGTPFTLVEVEEKGYTLLIGNSQVMEWTETKEEALKMTEIENLNWQTLTSMIAVLVEKWQEIKHIKEKLNS